MHGKGVTGSSSLGIPFSGLVGVGGYPVTLFIEVAETILGRTVSKISGLLIPGGSGFKAAVDAVTFGVTPGNLEERIAVTSGRVLQQGSVADFLWHAIGNGNGLAARRHGRHCLGAGIRQRFSSSQNFVPSCRLGCLFNRIILRDLGQHVVTGSRAVIHDGSIAGVGASVSGGGDFFFAGGCIFAGTFFSRQRLLLRNGL